MEPTISVPVSALAALLHIAAEWREADSGDDMDRAAIAYLAISYGVPLSAQELVDLERALRAYCADEPPRHPTIGQCMSERERHEIAGAVLAEEADRLSPQPAHGEDYAPHDVDEDPAAPDLGDDGAAAEPQHESAVKMNAREDPNYCPYCLRCVGLVRMRKIAPFYWRCACGAECDER